jgi:hypothetical protein
MERKLDYQYFISASIVWCLISRLDTLLAAAQETHATSLAPKATFTQAPSIQKHMAHFPMLHVGLEASSIPALPDVST